MSNMMKWAENELRLAGYPGDEDGPNKWIYEGTLDLLKVFTEQGHSGMSAPYAISLFKRLANWEPISPLTGEMMNGGKLAMVSRTAALLMCSKMRTDPTGWAVSFFGNGAPIRKLASGSSRTSSAEIAASR